MKVKILGRIWNFMFVPASELRSNHKQMPDRGACDNPTKKGKKICILKGMKPKEELEVVIHECLHAAEWNMDEEWVDTAGTDIANVLWRLGWRKKDGGDSGNSN